MMIRTTLLSLSTLAALSLSLPALADDADKAACGGLAQGDDCVDGDGAPGQCLPDVDDAVLSCEDLDTVACFELAEGASCVDEEGDDGTCVPDASDGGRLHCEDDLSSDDYDDDSAAEREADRAACVDREVGDACTEADGDAGACKVDDSDDSVLECDDDAAGAAAASAGCSASGGAGAAGSGALIGLALALGALRRRDSRAR